MNTEVQFQRGRTRSRSKGSSVIRAITTTPLGGILAIAATTAAAPFENIRTNQPGWTITWEGQVEFLAPEQSPAPARTNQFLNFGDALQTLALSRAVVRLQDWSDLRLKDRTRLEIVAPPAPAGTPGLRLRDGEMYFSSRGGPRAFSVETPHARGVPKGTEFLVRVDAARTEVTMFDGEVELSNGVDSKPVRSGEQGVAVPGQPIQVFAKVEARNLVQWWIYYPAVIDLDELGLSPAEEADLSTSLAAYRRGNLSLALRSFPGFPTPDEGTTAARRGYLAALLLSVGAVDRADRLLGKGDTNTHPARALRTMIAAVTGGGWNPTNTQSTPNAPSGAPAPRATRRAPSPRGEGRGEGEFASTVPPIASELLALSYAHQSTNNLKAALRAARQALSSGRSHFGFAWARVAELEFSFGHTRAAREAVERALGLSPENAQAHAVRGFLLAADYKIHDAIAAFDQAIALDPALGNAWLGRGLCKRRLGIFESRATRKSQIVNRDWLSDLQTAAALEPRRSLVRAYLGKAFSEVGDARLAQKELTYAAQLDPNDPTPPLYKALELYQENRPNEAVRELERSIELNDNRAVQRSRLLLDEDHATRSASLAKIYQSAGLDDVALREAARAVSYDYANASAHQFLAESYDALRDPARFNLRYETVWFNELLLANLLSPVGAGLLSQNISQQEYSPLFAANRLGLFSSTEVRSDGKVRQLASHSALLGRTTYTLDLDYQHNNGTRPNSDLERIDWYSQFKHQLNDRDSVFILVEYQELNSGDNFQRYDPTVIDRTLRVRESQAPVVVGALHRQWSPGQHTLLFGGRLETDLNVRQQQPVLDLRTNNTGDVERVLNLRPFGRLDYQDRVEIYQGELQHLIETERHSTVAGSRFQLGDVGATATLQDPLGTNPAFLNQRYGTPLTLPSSDEFCRWSLYGYHTREVVPDLRLTGGFSYDQLRYPANFRFPPLSRGSEERERLSPKAALNWTVNSKVAVRGIYSQGLGGVSLDESFRLEPTQLAGFSQAFRSVISEAEVGSVAAPRVTVTGLALDWKPTPPTFLGLEAQSLESFVDQAVGVFVSRGTSAFPSTVREKLGYRERSFGLSLGRLLGDEWAVSLGYHFTQSELDWRYPAVPSTPAGSPTPSPARSERACLHRVQLVMSYHHSGGFFARGEAQWFGQENDGYGESLDSTPRPGDSFAQFNLLAGYRFAQRRAEISMGGLNLAAQDYRLNSLTPYAELPRERVFLARLKWNW